jgi:hypothetical protein
VDAPNDTGQEVRPKEKETFAAYIQIVGPVFYNRQFSDKAKLLYGLLAAMTQAPRYYAFARNSTLMKFLCCSERTLQRCLSELEDAGELSIENGSGGRTIRKIRLTRLQPIYPDKNDGVNPDKNDGGNKNKQKGNKKRGQAPSVSRDEIIQWFNLWVAKMELSQQDSVALCTDLHDFIENRESVGKPFNTIKAAATLGVDAEWAASLAEKRDRLVRDRIGRDGYLQEWIVDRPNMVKGQRHTSHLIGVFPGSIISMEKTPELAKAAMKSLELRGLTADNRRSWTWPWRTALWARFRNADKAYSMVQHYIRYNVLDNLFGNHPPMQMDGTFGMPGGMSEMLIQSHEGRIALLPAIPAVWHYGSFRGLHARGNFVVDAAWKDSSITEFTVQGDGTCVIALPKTQTAVTFTDDAGNAYTAENEITAGYVLGGTLVVTDATARAVFGLAENAVIEMK